jgi:DNA replication protein DnaC
MIADLCPCLDGVIPPHYAKAELSDLPKSLVETFLALPDDKGLYLWGEPGRGKTHACCAFVRHLWTHGWDVARVSYEMLALRIRDSYTPGSKTSELAVITPLLSVGKLVVEDVGTTVSMGQQESEFSLRTFLVLLDQRLEQCLATFVTTNKSVEELGKTFDQRIASRLLEACQVVKLSGADRRKEIG